MATAKGVPMLTDHTRWRIIERTRLKNNEDLKNTTFSSLPSRIKDEHGSSLQSRRGEAASDGNVLLSLHVNQC